MKNTNFQRPPKEVNSDTVYTEMYNEMRRFREYQFINVKWYTTIYLTILSAIFYIKYGIRSNDFIPLLLSSSFRFTVVIISLTLCFNSCHTILYTHKRYTSLRNYTDKQIEPKWKKFSPDASKFQPHNLLITNQIILAILVLAALFWPL